MTPTTLRFTIPGTLPGLNDYVYSCRANRYSGNRAKRDAEACITPFLPRPVGELRYPVAVSVVWWEPTNRRDVDNVTFGIKFVLDALVSRGLLRGDGRRYVRRITHDVATDRARPRIEVEVEEAL